MNRTGTIQALSYGPEVASLLDTGKGRVLAVLSNALYLETSKGYVVAIVGEDAVDGPLSLRVLRIAPLLDTLRGTQDLTFRAVGQVIEIGQLCTISTAQARPWVPDLPACLGAPTARGEAAQTLAHAIAAHSESGKPGLHLSVSLAHTVRLESASQHRSPTDLARARIAESISTFTQALHTGETASAARSLESFIGLGPGLTPSGDDLVSGIVAVLAWQSRLGTISENTSAKITASIRHAASRTNRISARLLHHACEGILYAPAMDLGAALLAGDSDGVAGPLSRLTAIGSTTGLDLATGLLVGCLATLPAA